MGLLRPVAMSKVGVIGLRDDRERVLNVLHDLRLAQIESLPAEALAQLLPERATDVQRQIGDEALRFRGLRNALPPVPVGPPRILSSLPDILAAAKSVTIDAEVGELKREDDRLTTEEKAIDESVALLAKLSFYPDRLENLRAKSFVSFFGEGTAEARVALRAGLPLVADPLFLEDPGGATDSSSPYGPPERRRSPGRPSRTRSASCRSPLSPAHRPKRSRRPARAVPKSYVDALRSSSGWGRSPATGSIPSRRSTRRSRSRTARSRSSPSSAPAAPRSRSRRGCRRGTSPVSRRSSSPRPRVARTSTVCPPTTNRRP